MKKTLIVLTSIAVVLGIITFFVVFYSGGTYVVNSPLPSDSTYSSSTANASTTLTSSTIGMASSTSSSTATSSGDTNVQEYATQFNVPPVSWSEGNETISVNGATLSGSQLTLNLTIAMGAVAECVPLNIRFVSDEQGDLTAPLTSQFEFPDSGTCQGTPGANYGDQEVVFTVDPTISPLVFTSGGTSNVYFEIATTSANGLSISLPPNAD